LTNKAIIGLQLYLGEYWTHIDAYKHTESETEADTNLNGDNT